MAHPIPVEPEALLSQTARLRGLVRDLLRDEHEIDDVLQQTVAATLARGPRDGSRLGAFMGAIARNLAFRTRRTAARTGRRERAAARPEAVPSAAEIAEREEARRHVVDALLALDEPYRGVLALRYFDELSPKAIAARLGAPASTVRTQLQRGLTQLRERLDRAFNGRRAWVAALLPLLGASEASAALPAAVALAAVACIGVAVWVGIDALQPGQGASIPALGVGVGGAVRPSPPLRPDLPPIAAAAAPAADPGPAAGDAAPPPVPAEDLDRRRDAEPDRRRDEEFVGGLVFDEAGVGVASVDLLFQVLARPDGADDDPVWIGSSVVTTGTGGSFRYRVAEHLDTRHPEGWWAIDSEGEFRPPAAYRFRLELATVGSSVGAEWLLVDGTPLEARAGARDLQIRVRAMPAVRVAVLDAATHLPVDEPRADGESLAREADGRIVLRGAPGPRTVSVDAPGYTPQAVPIEFPSRGVVGRAEAVLLERGCTIRGTVRSPEGESLVATVVAERLGGDPASPEYLEAPTDAAGRWELPPGPPGRYRVMGFVRGWTPAAHEIDLGDGGAEVALVLRPRTGDAAPGTPRYGWLTRRGARIALNATDVPGIELVEWIEVLLDAPIARDAEVEARLARRSISPSFTRTPVQAALRFLCDVAELGLDVDRGALLAKE